MEFKIILFQLVLFSVIYYANFTSAEILKVNKTELSNNDYQVLKSFHKLEEMLKTFSKSISESGLPFMMRIFEEVNISSPCVRSGIYFLRDLRQLQEWPFKLLDSIGKTSGLLSGTFWIYGNYDQCLNIERQTKNSNEIIHGKYCAINFMLPKTNYNIIKTHLKNMKIFKLLENIVKPFKFNQMLTKQLGLVKTSMRFDICIPSECSQNDLNNILHWMIPDSFIVEVEFCKLKEKKMEFSTAQYVCLITFGLFIIWVIIGTIVDMLVKFHIIPVFSKIGKYLKCLISVSICTSAIKLFGKSSYQENTRFLCGIKFITICIIIFGHSYAYNLSIPTTTANAFNAKYLFENVRMEISYQGLVMIETFFFISGFLNIFLRKNNKRMSKIQYFSFIFSKYMRLTLPMLCILAFIIIIPLFGDGPHWEVIKYEAKTTEKYWWIFIFHIQNFYFVPGRIFAHLWFLGTLMQLTILTFFLLIIKERWPRIEIILLNILILAGIASQISIMLIKKQNAMYSISLDIEKFVDYFKQNYTKPYTSHLSSYCMGLLIGNVLLNDRGVKFRKNKRFCFWIISVVLLGTVLFGLYNYRNDVSPNETIILIHQIFSPIAWIAVITWITIACVSGSGGMLNKFLSLGIFVVLERLIIWIYLIHPLMLFYIFGEQRNPWPLTEMNLWMRYLLMMFLSIFTSIFFYIFFDIPQTYLFHKLPSWKSVKQSIPDIEVTKI